jgi:ubiquinol-cytochrome c reductase cytochrome b/c1 subunit
MAVSSPGTPHGSSSSVGNPIGAANPLGSVPSRNYGRLVRWIDYRLPFVASLEHHLIDYPTPVNLSYWWNFGSLAGIVLVIMIVTGVVLAMYYTPDSALAFDSVERIMRDVNYGWLIRYIHMNGASAFFLIVYIHLFRGLYYGSYKYPRELLWMLGVVILLLMIATAFMGYVLPWGQMSYWAATVITSLFSAIPLIGHPIVTLLWGGYAVGNPTLNRFFSLHYLLPFIIVAVIGLHLMALHQHGSNNPLGIDKRGPQDTIPFHPYYTVKDMFGLCVFLVLFSIVVFYLPNYLVSPDNYTPANPMQTPPHIVPEWYLLPYYAILRSITFSILGIPAKLLGVIAAFGSLIILFFVPWLDTSPVRSARFRPIYRLVSWLLPIDAVALGYVGSQPPQGWIITLGQVATFYYYFHFLILLPVLGRLERPRPLPIGIAEAVLGDGSRLAAAAASASTEGR